MESLTTERQKIESRFSIIKLILEDKEMKW